MPDTYQGRPCAYGHDGLRYTSNRGCVNCTRDTAKAAYSRDYEREKKRVQRAVGRAMADGSHPLDAADLFPDLLG